MDNFDCDICTMPEEDPFWLEEPDYGERLAICSLDCLISYCDGKQIHQLSKKEKE